MVYTQHRDTQATLAVIESLDLDGDPPTQEEIAKKFGWEDDYHSDTLSRWQQIKPRVWALFDEPWSIFYRMHEVEASGYTNYKKAIGADKPYTTAHPYFFFIDLICNIWFTIELVIRSIFCPSFHRFVRSPLTIIDIFCTSAFYVELILHTILIQTGSLVTIDFLSMICVLRLFKLTQHFSGLKILIQTFKASAQELILLVFFVILAIVIFAALVYYAERSQQNQHNQFSSIGVGLWWSLITISTVGFGDMVPKTYLGMVVGSLCALMGVLTIALPVPVIVSNFSNLYSHAQARAKLPKKRRRVLQAHEVKPTLLGVKHHQKHRKKSSSAAANATQQSPKNINGAPQHEHARKLLGN
ncbi:hypothetical protein WR25_20912 [Diploscapter pachys]|uniref:Ion transport domain-containing protein n=1 Tax=Diploscapter pachys TaxID=2018661 RepID=A0A2A2JDB2_9BILA|nr:hypothetical protein WR25_20912 [Diploscapter pachys]